MKRVNFQILSTFGFAQRRATVFLIAAATLLSGSDLAQANGGERIISSRVVSDTVVGSSDSSGGCAGGDCGAGGGGGVGGVGVGGGANGRTVYGNPDLFYNYYTDGASNSANAQMYVSPVPVPPHVGHTFLTYQPFYPHEMLYWHHDKFHNYYDNGRGMNRTSAMYYSPPIRQAVSNLYWNKLRLPR